MELAIALADSDTPSIRITNRQTDRQGAIQPLCRHEGSSSNIEKSEERSDQIMKKLAGCQVGLKARQHVAGEKI